MLKLRILDLFFTEINVFVITQRVKYRKKVLLGTGTEFFKCERYPTLVTSHNENLNLNLLIFKTFFFVLAYIIQYYGNMLGLWSFAYKEHNEKHWWKVRFTISIEQKPLGVWLFFLHIPLHFPLSSDLFLTSLRYSMEIRALIVSCNIGRTINGRNITLSVFFPSVMQFSIVPAWSGVIIYL